MKLWNTERRKIMDDDDIQDYINPTEERNKVLEEVAREFDAMKSLGDTAASFAAFVRGMKR
jgi:hypothetical protein